MPKNKGENLESRSCINFSNIESKQQNSIENETFIEKLSHKIRKYLNWDIVKILYGFSILITGLWVFVYSLFVGVAPPVIDKDLFIYLFFYLPLTIFIFFFFLVLSLALIETSGGCPNTSFQSNEQNNKLSLSYLFFTLSIITPIYFILQVEQIGKLSLFSIAFAIVFIFPAFLALFIWYKLTGDITEKGDLNKLRSDSKFRKLIGDFKDLFEMLNLKCFISIFSRAFGFISFIGGQLYFTLFMYLLKSKLGSLTILCIFMLITNFIIALIFWSFTEDFFKRGDISIWKFLKKHFSEYSLLVTIVVILLGGYIVSFPFYLSKLGFVKAKLFEKGRSQPTEIFLLWRTSNWIVYKVIIKKKVNKNGKEIKKEILSEDVFMKALSNDDYIEFIPAPLSKLYELFSSSNSSQQKANSQSSRSQKTSKGGHQSQIQAGRGQKGLQGKQKRGDQRSLSSHRRKTSESAGSGEKRRQSKTYTRRQPDTAGQRE